ncbi:tRNA uridine-5-carboxymethylaminomethyl(34) synthesis GTPase MnmE [Simkania negevensis]|uniref:tRNA modification GTPase MnmE n=1 Tax=Simkania negevensis (strain ATCC VR-1471 / DSM 27360 / Z) TaxID=331113 RepID=F8L5U8_SIMNZ|nr:tRNA uridine-5-carboxymethylaminomethyl(34) synthesis GTPase MnmE [Simkania negevensis]CCB88090.1 tRNA modification GTPase mnmE [Simkania negevensis Z]
MEFTHRTYEKGQTIAAVATPPGEGGIAVIRISGDEALDVADKIFSGSIHSYKTHTVHFGNILDENGAFIDEGLVIVMRTPRSYTGEDTVEIHCHGGTLITQKVLKAALRSGARAALPGEFTCKAFQNGKIDLTKAEAVQQVIASKNSLAMQAAENQLQGKLYKTIASFQQKLTDIAAILEAWVDFPEEGLEFASHEEMLTMLTAIIERMQHLLATFHEGKRLQTGLSICLLGAPNVGKSSLMNAIVGKDRAIVTDIPGTTRDILEEEIEMAGLNFRLLDTAGIREAEEIVEREGVRRSIAAAKEADLILLVVDISNPSIDSDLMAILPKGQTLLVWNKTDLKAADELPKLPFEAVRVSAKNYEGLEELKEAVHQIVWKSGPPSKEEVVLTNERHFQSLDRAIQATQKVSLGLQEELSPEFLTSDIRLALKELGTIIGVNITEDILSAIFSKFCVGK